MRTTNFEKDHSSKNSIISVDSFNFVIMSAETKPININEFQIAIKDLSDENLHSIKNQLINSISKLKDTDDILENEIIYTKEEISNLKERESHDQLKNDLDLYSESIEENKIVIENQNQRLVALNEELKRRGLALESGKEDNGVYL